jgi:tRNA(Ile)-lysidine synthase
VHPLAQKVLDHIRREELLTAGDRVGVAVSGGTDSVGLLRLLLELRGELGIVLSVVHLNHQLRGAESDADQAFVSDLARAHGLDFDTQAADVAQHAADEHISLETAARQMRYEFFERLLGAQPTEVQLDKIATGHTLDDQAETVLLRVIRGTGMRGLRGIQPRIPVEDSTEGMTGEIIRPLLAIRRHELEQYLGSIGQPWREDSTNADPKFTRNRVRHVLLPLLESEFNPAIAETLAELADIAREEEDYWDGEVAGWMGTAVQWSEPEWMKNANSAASLVQIQPGGSLIATSDIMRRVAEPGTALANVSISLGWFLSEPLAVRRRVVKSVADELSLPLEFKHIERVVRFAAEDNAAGKSLTLPLGWCVLRDRDALVFVAPDLRRQERAPDYGYALPLPGRVVVPELYAAIEAVAATPNGIDDLLDPKLLGEELVVRNWRPGDRFWPAHTKGPKKIKELLQDKHVPEWQRHSWPVVLSGDEIVWVRGFPLPARYRPAEGQGGIVIREVPLDPTQT